VCGKNVGFTCELISITNLEKNVDIIDTDILASNLIYSTYVFMTQL
jgi:hypothetical protein